MIWQRADEEPKIHCMLMSLMEGIFIISGESRARDNGPHQRHANSTKETEREAQETQGHSNERENQSNKKLIIYCVCFGRLGFSNGIYSKCCIVGNWTCLSFLKTFHLSFERLQFWLSGRELLALNPACESPYSVVRATCRLLTQSAFMWVAWARLAQVWMSRFCWREWFSFLV